MIVETDANNTTATTEPTQSTTTTTEPTSTVTDTQTNTTQNTQSEPTKTEPVAFKLPDEFKDKSWASKIKTQEDLYKQIDGLSSLVGKKNAYPTLDATPEQLDEYFQGLRPQSQDVYKFGDNHPNPEIAKKFGEMLYNANISEHQSKKLIESYQAFEQATIAEATSAEGFEKIMTEKFGKGYDSVVSTVTNSLKEVASPQTQEVLNKMPNEYLGAMYEVMNSFIKAYGANEGGDKVHSQKGSTPNAIDIQQLRSDLRTQIDKMVLRPHTQEEKQVLIDKLNATYK